jgi:hypothetical protein
LWITATEINPAAPHNRQRLCVGLRPSVRAKTGSTNEQTKHTAEYMAKNSCSKFPSDRVAGRALL